MRAPLSRPRTSPLSEGTVSRTSPSPQGEGEHGWHREDHRPVGDGPLLLAVIGESLAESPARQPERRRRTMHRTTIPSRPAAVCAGVAWWRTGDAGCAPGERRAAMTPAGETTPSLTDVRRMVGHGNVVPIYREVRADLETPVSAYLKVARGDFAFLLESVEGGERLGRYSFIGAEPYKVLRCEPGRWRPAGGDPGGAVAIPIRRGAGTAPLPRRRGGLPELRGGPSLREAPCPGARTPWACRNRG